MFGKKRREEKKSALVRRAERDGSYARTIHETTGEPLLGETLLTLAQEKAKEDFMHNADHRFGQDTEYIVSFLLSYTQTRVVLDTLDGEEHARPKDASLDIDEVLTWSRDTIQGQYQTRGE